MKNINIPMLDTSNFRGVHDKLANLKIRIGIIDDPFIDRYKEKQKVDNIDPIEEIGAINFKTGRVAIRWLDNYGGVKMDKNFGDDDNMEYGKRQIIQVMYPAMWSSNNKSNWCGFLSIPTYGSIVAVGFRDKELPIIIGYLNGDWEICANQITKDEKYRNKTIRPGEQIVRGYGNSFIYWQQIEKLQINSTKYRGDKNSEKTVHNKTVKADITLSALEENLTIKILDDNGNNAHLIMKPAYAELKTNNKSAFSNIIMTPTTITANTATFTVNSVNSIINAQNSITMNAGNSIVSTAGNMILEKAGNAITSISPRINEQANVISETAHTINNEGSSINIKGGVVKVTGTPILLN